MPVTYAEGNILDIKSGIICHQANHKGVMGAGLAKKLRDKYPEIMTDYLRLCKIPFEYLREYGTVSFYDIPNSSLSIASIFGQDGYGRDKCYTDYHALKFGLQTVLRKALFESMNVYIPHGIGCGLAGGDWETVKMIIEDVFHWNWDVPHVYVLKLPLDKTS